MNIALGGLTITFMGMLTFGAVVLVWFARRQWTQYVIAAAAVFPQTSAFVVLDNGFPLFYFAVVLIALLSTPYLLLALAHPGTVPAIAARPGRWPDVLAIILVAWGALITIAGPRIFAGMLVFAPELGIGSIENMIGLQPGLGNVAQLGYLTIAVLFLLLAGRLFPVDKRMVATVVWLVIILATVRLVAEPVWPRELLQTMPGFNYATPERLSGTLHEPSVLGMYLAVAAAYFAVQLRTPGRARAAALLGLAIVAVDFLANSSGTALLGLGLVAALGVGVGVIGMLASGRVRVQPWTIAAGAVLIGGALTQIPLLYAMTVGYAADKTETSSFAERSASNFRAWEILQESLGLGIGLGSNRPSSLLFLVLAGVGVIGFGLLVALVTIGLRRASASPATYGLGWALVAALVAAGVAVPDLSAPLLWVTLAACLTAVRTAPLNPTLNPPTRAPATPPFGWLRGSPTRSMPLAWGYPKAPPHFARAYPERHADHPSVCRTGAGYPEGRRMTRDPITMTLPDRLQVGCDVHSVSNVIQSIEVFGDRYLERVFTTAERIECAGPRAAERLAGRFAAKEAVLKALRVPSDVAVPWPTIEVLADAVGAPTVSLTGTAADFAAQQGIARIELSLSHDCGVALAFAVAIPTAWSAGEYAA